MIEIPCPSEQYQNAKPFPHIVVDDLFDQDIAFEASQSFPKFEEATKLGMHFLGAAERHKVGISDWTYFPQPIGMIHAGLAEPSFVEWLSKLSGIEGLEADPQLLGGGMHIMGPQSRLDVHVDFNQDSARGLYRRMNLLLFLNPGWDEAWGGAVELWNEDVSECVGKFPPIHNRTVIFDTGEKSWHGVEPVNAPTGVTRNSLSAYYYTREPPPEVAEAHSTIFVKRPGE